MCKLILAAIIAAICTYCLLYLLGVHKTQEPTIQLSVDISGSKFKYYCFDVEAYSPQDGIVRDASVCRDDMTRMTLLGYPDPETRLYTYVNNVNGTTFGTKFLRNGDVVKIKLGMILYWQKLEAQEAQDKARKAQEAAEKLQSFIDDLKRIRE